MLRNAGIRGIRGLGDAYDDCKAGADQSTAQLDAMYGKGSPLAMWSPSDYWDPEALRAIVTKGQAVLSAAYAAIAQAKQSCIENISCPQNNMSLLDAKYDRLTDPTTQSQNYLAAIDSAEQSAAAAVQTVYVKAPNVKVWAEDVFEMASEAMSAAYVVSCMKPWWASAWSGLVTVANDFLAVVTTSLGVAKDVVDAAVAAGQAVYQVAKESAGFLRWLTQNAWPITGVVALGLAGFAAYRHRDQLRALVHRK